MLLKTLIEIAEEQYKQEIRAHHRMIAIPIKSNDDFMTNGSSKATALGMYFEYLTKSIHGGELKQNIRIMSANGDYERYKPDVVHKKKKIAWEAKACVTGSTCNLLDYQIRKIMNYQFDNPEFTLYFAFYRHQIFGIKSSYKKSEDELYHDLNQSRKYAVILPLSIVERLHNRIGVSEKFIYRYEGQTYDNCTCLRSSFLNRLLKEPEKIIDELNWDEERIIIERYRSPANQFVNSGKVSQFPIMWMKDKGYRQWVEDTMKEMIRQVPF